MNTESADGFAPRRERVLFGLYLLILAAAFVAIAARRPLWYDELFSWYVAQQEGPLAVLRALLSGADNGPPLDYWLRQLSVDLLGDNALAFRTPSILAFLAALLCLWSFARRRLSPGAASAAVLLPVATASLYYATEGRAYATLLFLQSFSLLAWQRAIEDPGSRRWPIALYLSLAAAPLAHYYGVLNYIPVLAGEVVRLARRGSWSKAVGLGIGLSLPTMLLLPPFARNALEMREAFWASDYGAWMSLSSYKYLLGQLLYPVLALVLLAGLLQWFAERRHPGERQVALRQHELAAAAALILLPFVVLIMAVLVTNAMTHRYAIVSCLGFALLAAHSMDRIERHAPVLSRLLVAALLLWSGWQLSAAFEGAGARESNAELEAQLGSIDAKIAVECPRLFLESYHELPEGLGGKLFYLSDRAESRRRLGYDNDEIAMEKLTPWVPVNIEPYESFVERERDFLVLADANRCWLLARLRDEGAQLHLVTQIGTLEFYRVSWDPVPAPSESGASSG